MRRSFFCLAAVVLLAGSFAGSASAFKYPLGDLGKPADYYSTMKSLGVDKPGSYPILPESFNWKTKGMVTPAKDQGDCGASWAFAAVGVFESQLLMAHAGLYDLSEQQLISCNVDQSGCASGDSTALRYWEWNGPMLESCTLYPSSDGSVPLCGDQQSCSTLDWRTRSFYYYDYETADTPDLSAMKYLLQLYGPAYLGFTVYGDFETFWDTAESGSVYTQTTGTSAGGHAVLLIGWDNAKKAWLCKNSWGATSGPNGDGTFWIAYEGHANDLELRMAVVHISPLLSCGYRAKPTTFDFVEVRSLRSSEVLEVQIPDEGLTFFESPFPIIFYCQQYRKFAVDSKGRVHFSVPNLSSGDGLVPANDNGSLPSTTWVSPFAAPFWMDLALGTGSAGGKVYATVTGTAPNRVFIIEWKDVSAKVYTESNPEGILSTGTVTFEMKYFEATGIIEYHYLDTIFSTDGSDPEYAMNNGAKATIGIQRSSEEAVQYSYNKTNAVSSGTALKFLPPAGKTGTLTVNISPAEAVNAGAWWRLNDLDMESLESGQPLHFFSTFEDSGQSLVVLAGAHRITFPWMPGYGPPADQTVTVFAGRTTTATGTYTEIGNLSVSITPAAAVTAGAQWFVDDDSPRSSGTTLPELTIGTHTLSFTTIPGWVTPAQQTVTISRGRTTSATGTYAQITGSQPATRSPDTATTNSSGIYTPAAGSTAAHYDSVTAVSAVTPAQVEEQSLQGGRATVPGVDAVSLSVSSLALTGYAAGNTGTPAPLPGTLTVILEPTSAVTAGAQWQVDGGSWRNSGETVPDLSAGTHAVAFKALKGYTAPRNKTVTISNAATTSVSGSYIARSAEANGK